MIYDVKRAPSADCASFFFPRCDRPTTTSRCGNTTARADLLLLGELNYAGPLVAEVTGIPWASYLLAPFSFFSAYDPPVLPPYPKLARAEKVVPRMGHLIKRVARFVTRTVAAADL